MSLRSTYVSTLSSALIASRYAGVALITAQSVNIASALTANANKGLTSFTITYPVTFQPADVKFGGKLWFAYKSGMELKLMEVTNGDLMDNEFTVQLNLSDQSTVQVDIVFSF